VLAAGQLRKHGHRGRAIILVTDGQETTSKATLARAVHAARTARASVYAIGIADRTFNPRPLLRLTSSTGGKYYRAPSPAALTAIYRRIAAELARTWQLRFVTAARPGDALKLTVTVGGSRGTARTAVPSRLEAGGGGGSSRLLVVCLIVVVATLVGLVLFPAARSFRPRLLRRSQSY